MENEIELVSDGDGLALIGKQSAIESFLRSEGLSSLATKIDLRRLIATGANIAQAASEMAANSAVWLKLTPESADLVKKYGLMETKTPGVSHAMIGSPGSVQKWLQIESGPGCLLTNPAMLSGAAGVMAQIAVQQTMAEITDYLARINAKVDDVLGKVDDTVLKDMRGARFQIRRAMTMRQHEGRVTDDSWSEVQNASGKLADVQGYALLQLDAAAEKLEKNTTVRKLAETADDAKADVEKWLAVLAECFQLQEAFDVLALDRVLDEPPAVVDARRQGLERDRLDRQSMLSEHTKNVLARMDVAVRRANARLFWNREKSPTIVQSGNRLAAGVHDFLQALDIRSDRRTWEVKQLGRTAEMGAQTLQSAKDAAPVVGAVAGAAALVLGAGKALNGEGSKEEA